jgi:membrane protein implicated in regulation of membrane protease activity
VINQLASAVLAFEAALAAGVVSAGGAAALWFADWRWVGFGLTVAIVAVAVSVMVEALPLRRNPCPWCGPPPTRNTAPRENRRP